jgi:hypothetical protein
MQAFLNTLWLEGLMKKALAQNPNLLRTLIGLSLTLIFMLSYAVYGATVSPSVYIYETASTVDEYSSTEASENAVRLYDEEANTTTWAWQVSANGANLTWVNVTATEVSAGTVLRVTNGGKLYSHELLGTAYDLSNPHEDEFSCAEQCAYEAVHERTSEEGGEMVFHALTSVDPARRSNGMIAYTHSPSLIRIELVEQGNRTTQPGMMAETVNEAFASVEVFSVDAATEFLWALAAVVGCFSMVLIPSFTVYFAARAKEKRDEAKLALSNADVDEEVSQAYALGDAS